MFLKKLTLGFLFLIINVRCSPSLKKNEFIFPVQKPYRQSTTEWSKPKDMRYESQVDKGKKHEKNRYSRYLSQKDRLELSLSKGDHKNQINAYNKHYPDKIKMNKLFFNI